MVDLTLLNHWWKGKEGLEQDKHLRDFQEKRYQWKPALLEELEFTPGNIFTLRGPRQVGKTTLIKLWIKKLLLSVPAPAIFYWNCDELVDFRELSFLLKEYLQLAEIQGLKTKYLFLDEISRIKDWQRSIKFLADAGELRHCFLLLTGSHMLDLKHGFDRLPGRTGTKGRELLLLPLRFSEFVSLVRPDLPQTALRELTLSEIHRVIPAVAPFLTDFQILLGQYLRTGGFPLVINEFLENKVIPEYLYELYFRWVVGDLVKWGKQEKIFLQLMKSVLLKQSSAISWDSLAKEAEIKSPKTISSYVEMLQNMFVFTVLYFLERNKGVPDYNKNKKIYFSDPFLYHIFNRKIYFKEDELPPALIEAVVAAHLARRGGAYYWQGKKEVDIVLWNQGRPFPIEVKYQNRISREDYLGLYSFNIGILATKNHLELGEKYGAVPVALVLAVV